MDFSLSDEQKLLRDTIVRFARDELNDGVAERDRAQAFPREAWQRCAQVGLQGLPVPEQYGGSGLDPLGCAIALEAFGYDELRARQRIAVVMSVTPSALEAISGVVGEIERRAYARSLPIEILQWPDDNSTARSGRLERVVVRGVDSEFAPTHPSSKVL